MTKETEPKEVHAAKELKEEKAQERGGSTLFHAPLVAQEHEVPHPHKLQEETKDEQFAQFLEIFKKLHINIPFAEVLEKMPPYMALMKSLLSEKKNLKGDKTVVLTKECSALIQRKLPKKMPDPKSCLIPCIIGNITFKKALCDLGSSINLMPLSVMKKLRIQEAQATRITLQTADKSLRQAYGLVENVLVKVGELFLSADYVILDIREATDDSIILGRPFLATGRVLIDVEWGELVLRCALSTKEGDPKKKLPKGWRNKKVPTEDFSPGMRVVFTRSPVIPHTVNRILSLEHVELIHESTGQKFKMRGEDLSPYDPPP
ncbi:uncharacterized protein LOC130966048 [Arachis stenosperma]|uniref:uncharacterized protein LOC130966048 n=1 Tax=Arachis stenosperma TaxID=217475 RepID=UPI0025AB8E77|nr:uncharacterized protein LOC130966048 [Arachis stenosperma]